MARRPKFDLAHHDQNPEWTEEDFAKAKPASEMPGKMISFFKNTKFKTIQGQVEPQLVRGA